jgi:hypothetical protein
MTKDQRRVDAGTAKEILLDDPGFLREIAERVVPEPRGYDCPYTGLPLRQREGCDV